MHNFKNLIITNYFPIILFFFSIFICHYTGSRGVFPIDSFSHFDMGTEFYKGTILLRLLGCIRTFLNYWQSLIFIIRSELANLFIIFVHIKLFANFNNLFLFLNLGLHKKLVFLCNLFSILAYPSAEQYL